MSRVTSEGQAVTPEAVTPWSPAKSTIRRGVVRGKSVCWTSHNRAANSSSRPRLRAGFVSESRWFQMSCEPSDVMPSLQNSMPRWGLMPSRNGCLTIVISVTRSAISKSAGLALRPVTTTCSMGRFCVSSATTSARGR